MRKITYRVSKSKSAFGVFNRRKSRCYMFFKMSLSKTNRKRVDRFFYDLLRWLSVNSKQKCRLFRAGIDFGIEFDCDRDAQAFQTHWSSVDPFNPRACPKEVWRRVR